MTDRFAERLSDYLDGELDDAQRETLERHLEGCRACRDRLADLRIVLERLDEAPTIRPAQDLWPALKRRIETEPRRAGNRSVAWLLPAAAALALVGLLSIWRVVTGTGHAPPQAAPQLTTALPISGPEALAPYRRAVEEWRRVVEIEALPEPVASNVRADLAVYDRAVQEGLDALERMPDDEMLTAYVIRTLQAQVRLLERTRQATEML